MQGALLHKHHEREIINHRTVSGHPSVCSFHELFLMETHVVIVMEYAACGSLCSLLRDRRKLPEAVARRLFWQLLRGLQHCHLRNVFHRCRLSVASRLLSDCACRESSNAMPLTNWSIGSPLCPMDQVQQLHWRLAFVQITPRQHIKETVLITESMFVVEHDAYT